MPLINNKDYYIKVYRSGTNGKLIDTIYDFKWDSFRKQINGGLGDFSFTLSKPFDNFGQGNLIAHNNQVKMYVTDFETGPLGQLIYSGWIYAIETTIDGAKESVTVRCYGNVTKMATAILRSGNTVILYTSPTGLTATAPATASNIDTNFKSILDQYNANSTVAMVQYNASDIAAPNQMMTYTHDKDFITDALNLCKDLAPAGWYWYVPETNLIKFQNKATTPRHTFTFGKDFTKLTILNNADSVFNNLLFQDGHASLTILKRYYDQASINSLDDRWITFRDTRISSQQAADNFGNAYITNVKNPFKRITARIVDNNIDQKIGYNIELIQPGDTCQFKGFNAITSQNFNNNMQIVSVDYSADYADIEVEQLTDSAARQTLNAYNVANRALGTNGIATYS
ncbi:MAG TPA: hypothetical protein VNX65_02445 [Patescibacteria group bacterium]|jgi:hypothetical protein|nr:hypothetical protein [Patescibacteria group bacterium]